MNLRLKIFNARPAVLVIGAVLTAFMIPDGLSQQTVPNPAAAATNAFALDLYRQLADDKSSAGKNLWFSPYSITSALAMTAEGARGNTLAQMAKTLRFGDASPTMQLLPIHEGMAALGRQLTTTAAGGPAGSAPQAPYQLVVANALWGDRQYPFDQKYVDTINKHYATAGVTPVDFLKDPEAARAKINAWVEEQTRQKIANLLPQGSVSSATRLVLTNAVYFKGSWIQPFTARSTSSEPFHLDATRTVTAPLMRLSATLAYMENEQLQVLALPFRGQGGRQDMAMMVILPRQVDGLAAVEQSLVAGNLDAWIGALSGRRAQVFLPKFKMTESLQLGRVLQAMGMPDAFSGERADFSGMSPGASKDRLRITDVIHKAYLAVDEEGAEAAAATAGMMGGGAPRREEPVVFRADHPFLVLLRHNPSGTVLFLGRVMNPVAQ